MRRIELIAMLCAALLGGGLPMAAHAQPASAAAPNTASERPVAEIDRVVAVVNNDVITAVELALRTRAATAQLRRQRIELPPEDILRGQVLERMILERAQVQHAKDNGIRVDDGQVDRTIASIARQNNVSIAELAQRLQADGLKMEQFREEVRRDVTINRVREREVDARVTISEADIDNLLAERQSGTARSEYSIAQILLRVPEGANPQQIARQRERAEQLRQQAEAGADFARLAASYSDSPEAMSGGALGWRSADRLPELFLKAVSGMKPGQIASVLRSPNGFHLVKLLDRRDTAGAALSGGPVTRTKVRHILVRPSELLSESDALRRIRDIRERIVRGDARFADMARQYSSDGSAGAGGELNWVYQGDTVPEFERAMDALAPSTVSEPVRSPFGWHLIEVLERRTDEASADRLRQQARQILRERRIDEVYQEWLRELRDRTYVQYRLNE
jgi:peptidyl-prolyl cis-trans isomerase SurA